MKWWQRLVQRHRLERELDAELRFHCEQQVKANLRDGMSEGEARRRALAEFGGLEQVKEECRDARGTRWVDETAQDLRYAFRLLLKDRSFTFVAAATLAIGIGVNTAMFSVIESVLLEPLPYPHPERLVWISERDAAATSSLALVFGDDLEAWRSRSESFAALSVLLTGDATMGADEPVQVRVACLSESLTRVFGVAPVIGRDFLPQDFEHAPQAPGLRASAENRSDTGVAVLSDRLFRRLGGHPRLLGEPVQIGNVRYAIVGVLPPSYRLPVAPSLQLGVGARTDVDLVLNATVGRASRGPGAVLGRLKPGVPVDTAFAGMVPS